MTEDIPTLYGEIRRSTEALLAALAALAPDDHSRQQIRAIQQIYTQRKPMPLGETDG